MDDDHGYILDPEPVARGGQGEVYFGTSPDGDPVAVKVAAPGTSASRALMKEMELLRHMRDAGVQGVMPILDSFRYEGPDGDRPAMVMPRYPDHMGHWLKRVILEPGPGTLQEILELHARIARTIASVHKVYYEGGTVVHRDIKPENLFLDGVGNVFLGDFGGAMAVEELKAMELAMFGTNGQGIDGGFLGTDAVVAKGVIGGSYVIDIGSGLHVAAEYHYSGFGVDNIGDDPSILYDPAFQLRFARGDSQLLGRHAIAASVSYSLQDDLSGAIAYIQSPVDGSGTAGATFTWNQSDNVTILLNVFVPWGTPPESGVPTSEWGSSPLTIFLQARLYD